MTHWRKKARNAELYRDPKSPRRQRLRLVNRARARQGAMYTRLRQRVMNLCPLCGWPLPVRDGDCEIDHILPCNAGGGFEEENLQLTHKECNQKKSDALHVRYGLLSMNALWS